MKSTINRKKYLILFLILFAVLQFSTAVQKGEAILTSRLYSTLKYHDSHLQYDRIEYDSHFGEYLVSYHDKNGKVVSFMITPKFLPFFISYDPLDTSK
ncbi:hypothetical protein J2Z22_002845 [Paenibacillus forsythiae]|uniref:DUF3139 domain-containing protein n=1 Tax=Paenibacillus forsythiae TaxID=365616 RepID=A0ABU3H916_9BACL|nr:hypothetical protein [Paenibacillus forsythiae]